MKLTRGLVSLSLIFSLAFLSFLTLPVRTASAQETRIALQRGYRTGYSDGYMAGYRDSIDTATRSYTRHSEYARGDRAYNKDYGTIEEYRDGYQQGFETGYDTGFDKRSFEAAIPSGLGRRSTAETISPAEAAPAPVEQAPAAPVAPAEPVVAASPAAEAPAPAARETGVSDSTTPAADAGSTIQNASYRVNDAVIVIPRDTELIIELQDEMSTETAKEGDKFTARVVSPAEISGATIEGRIEKLQKPGRIKRRSEMLLSFDRIVVSDTRWSNFDAILSEVLPVKGDNIRRVDGEGTAVGKSTVKPDVIKVGAATGTGAGIGALAGGPVGAAVGAGVGAAFGVGAVVIQRGKNIKLNRSQQLRIKSSYETQIR